MIRVRRTVAALMLVAIGIASLPSQDVANAATPPPRVIPDQDGGGRLGINATRIHMWPRYRRDRVVVQVYGKNLMHKRLNGAEVWIDTNRKNPGPEWRFIWHLPGDGDGIRGTRLLKVNSFKDGGTFRKCARRYARKHLAKGYIEMQIPVACIGRPGRIRVAAATWDYTAYRPNGEPRRGYHDWVRGYRRLSARWF